jgi:hypothetical protein
MPNWGRPANSNDVVAIFSDRLTKIDAEIAALKSAPAGSVTAKAIVDELLSRLK